jgi:hypothetical protein
MEFINEELGSEDEEEAQKKGEHLKLKELNNKLKLNLH